MRMYGRYVLDIRVEDNFAHFCITYMVERNFEMRKHLRIGLAILGKIIIRSTKYERKYCGMCEADFIKRRLSSF